MNTNKISIYAPTSPRGKALKDAIPHSQFSSWKVQLIDEQELEGTLTEYDGGVELVKKTTMDALLDSRVIFFTDNFLQSQEYIRILTEKNEQQQSRLLIDLSSGVEGGVGEVVNRHIHEAENLTETRLVRIANPLAIGLAEILSLSSAIAPLSKAQATAMIPVSEFGKQGIEDLHNQLVELMNFSSKPESIFGDQLIFNMLPGFGHSGSRQDYSSYEKRISTEVRQLLNTIDYPVELVSAVVPTFYSFAVNLSLSFKEDVEINRLANGLSHAEGMQLSLHDVAADEQFDGPLAVSDSSDLHIIRCLQSDDDRKAAQLWCHFDNIQATSVKHALAVAEDYFQQLQG